MQIENVKRAAELMREANGLLAGGPLDFYLTEMAAAYDLLMRDYAPFRVRQRVVLRAAPDMTGWAYSKHFLVAGAAGTVVQASCGSHGFRFGVEFDNDTWIDRDGVKRPPTQKGIYTFTDRELRSQD